MSATAPPNDERLAPDLPRGFRDLLPSQTAAFHRMLSTIALIYRRFGFAPVETPALEYESTLRGQVEGETGKQIYAFTDQDGERVGLRFDLTVPLARLVACHARELRFPFKRAQYARVWRFDKVTPGRFREFGQFDADLVGTKSPLADAEVCQVIHEVLRALGFRRFVVRINHRRILNALAEIVGLSTETDAHKLFRELDKIDKQGFGAVRRNLGLAPDAAALAAMSEPARESIRDVDFLGLSEAQIARVADFLSLAGSIRQEPAAEGEVSVPEFRPVRATLDALDAFFADSESGRRGVAELRAVVDAVAAAQAPAFIETLGQHEAAGYLAVDVTIARGLDYYTGPVFETTLLDFPHFGSIFSGGRYDRLIGRFVDFPAFFAEFQEYRELWRDERDGSPLIPATGASLGVDRLFAVMQRLGLAEGDRTPTQVLVTTMDGDLLPVYQACARGLRDAGIAVELFTGDSGKLRAQLRYADRLGIPLCLIIGSDEHARGEVTLRDMRGAGERKSAEHKQETVASGDLVTAVRRALAGQA